MFPRRRSLFSLAFLALALAACLGGDGDDEPRILVDGTAVTETPAAATVTASPTLAPVPFTPAPPESDLDPERLTGFAWPLEGACLPQSDRLMPNAPRAYRRGVHEGVDWYDRSSCARVFEGMAVHAMYDGVVVRADLDYEELTPAALAELERRVEACECSEPDVLDAFRGRQLWIDHGSGVVTRYAHLGSIAAGMFVGAEVQAGEVIAAVGESGTPESLSDPGTEHHLHAEVRIGEAFLGAGLEPAEVRALYERLFAEP